MLETLAVTSRRSSGEDAERTAPHPHFPPLPHPLGPASRATQQPTVHRRTRCRDAGAAPARPTPGRGATPGLAVGRRRRHGHPSDHACAHAQKQIDARARARTHARTERETDRPWLPGVACQRAPRVNAPPVFPVQRDTGPSGDWGCGARYLCWARAPSGSATRQCAYSPTDRHS